MLPRNTTSYNMSGNNLRIYTNVAPSSWNPSSGASGNCYNIVSSGGGVICFTGTISKPTTYSLTATLNGDNNYNAASATITFNITNQDI